LEGRNGNNVKNRWYKHIVKQVLPQVQTADSTASQTDSGETETKPLSITLTVRRMAGTYFEGNHRLETNKTELFTFLQYVLN
jgi:hypothetical protein